MDNLISVTIQWLNINRALVIIISVTNVASVGGAAKSTRKHRNFDYPK